VPASRPAVRPVHPLRTGEPDPTGEPVVTLLPLRVTGPGRLERGYRARIHDLESTLSERERALELAALLERGNHRAFDRLAAEAARHAAERDDARRTANRLLVALGAAQREAEHLRARLEPLQLAAPGPRRWWRRLF
jgi:hypothetical protein